MKHVQIFIVEAKGQKDEITTPTLYSYKVFGSMKEAQEELDSIYNVLRTNPNLAPVRDTLRVDTRSIYPLQYWVIKPQFVTIAD